MDISLLADAVTQMLAPALPALVQGGQELIADAAKAMRDENIGDDNRAKRRGESGSRVREHRLGRRDRDRRF